MIRSIVLVVIALLCCSCRITGGRWVVDDVERRCPGGVVNTEKRMVDTWVGGRVRNTTIRTDACMN